MKLNGDTKNKVKKLVLLNKKIYKRYLSLEQNLEKEKNIQVILELIECEQNIIKELNLDKEKLSDIEKYIKSKRRLNLEEDLIKASLKVSAYDYPYLRALARIRYVYSKKNMFNEIDNTALFLDQEVATLYRSIKETELENPISQSILNHYSNILLINSFETEKAILINNMKPLDVYDSVEFASELYTAASIVTLIDNNVGNFQVSFDRIVRATLSRKDYFDKKFDLILKAIVFEMPKQTIEEEPSAYLSMLSSYFKSIFTLLDKPSRELIFSKMDTSKTMENMYDIRLDYLRDLIKTCEYDIETNLCPHIKHLSIFPY